MPDFGKTTKRFQVLSDSKIFGPLIVGLLIASISGLFYWGLGWGSMTTQVSELQASKKESSIKVEKIDKRVNTLEAVVPRIETSLKELSTSFKEALKEARRSRNRRNR